MKLSILGLGLAATVAADMQIFAGNTKDPYGGGSGRQLYFAEMGVKANCDNLRGPYVLSGDATISGASCDGCTAPQPNDWNISRLEMEDKNEPNGAIGEEEYGVLTAYGEGGGSYGLSSYRDGVEKRIGTCQRVKGEFTTCFRGLTTDEFIPLMNCFGPLTVA